MTWTPGKNWTTGEVVNVWKLETYLTGNLLSLRNLNDHACKVHAASSPPFDISAQNADTPVPFRIVDWQVGTGVFSTANPTKFLAPIAGWYEVIPTAVWDFSSGGTRTLGYRLNGQAPYYDLHTGQTNNNSFRITNCGLDIVRMTTADFLEVVVKQNSADDGLDLITGETPDQTRCSWRLIGAAS